MLHLCLYVCMYACMYVCMFYVCTSVSLPGADILKGYQVVNNDGSYIQTHWACSSNDRSWEFYVNFLT